MRLEAKMNETFNERYTTLHISITKTPAHTLIVQIKVMIFHKLKRLALGEGRLGLLSRGKIAEIREETQKQSTEQIFKCGEKILLYCVTSS